MSLKEILEKLETLSDDVSMAEPSYGTSAAIQRRLEEIIHELENLGDERCLWI